MGRLVCFADFSDIFFGKDSCHLGAKAQSFFIGIADGSVGWSRRLRRFRRYFFLEKILATKALRHKVFFIGINDGSVGLSRRFRRFRRYFFLENIFATKALRHKVILLELHTCLQA